MRVSFQTKSGFTCAVVLSVLLSGFAPVAAEPFAYVPNEGSGTISIIDTATDAVVGEINTGGRPRGIASGSTTLYFSDLPSGALKVVDLKNRAVTAQVALGKSPEGVYVSRDGKTVAVAVEENNSVALIDTAAMRVVANVPVKGKNPEHAVFSPDGAWIFVSAEDADTVEVIDVAKRAQVAAIKVGQRPRGIAFTADSRV
ncbi:MAG TPA: cytochrome D1 domain-containing protein, partial [Burkholderiales bacterium]